MRFSGLLWVHVEIYILQGGFVLKKLICGAIIFAILVACSVEENLQYGEPTYRQYETESSEPAIEMEISTAPIFRAPDSASYRIDSRVSRVGSVRNFVARLSETYEPEILDAPETIESVWYNYIRLMTRSMAWHPRTFDNILDIAYESSLQRTFVPFEFQILLFAYAHLNGENIARIEGREATQAILTDYAQRYFNVTLNFARVRRTTNHMTHFNLITSTMQSDRNTRNIAITRIERFPDGWVVVYGRGDFVGASGESIRYEAEKIYLMRERSDGSLYFVGGFIEYDTYIGVIGEGYLLDNVHSDWRIVTTSGENDFIVLREGTSDTLAYGILRLPSNEIDEVLYLPRERIVWQDDNMLTVITAEQIRIFDFDNELQPTFEWTAPDWLVEYTAMNAVQMMRSEWVTFSSDWTKAVISLSRDGVKLFDLETGQYTLIPGTESYIDYESEIGSEGFKFADFVMDESKLLLTRVGWEWVAGYMLYDIATGESTFYEHIGRFGMWRYDDRLYIADFRIDGGEPQPVYIDFATREVRPAPDLEERLERFFEDWTLDDEGEDAEPEPAPRFEVIRNPTSVSALEATSDWHVSEELTVFDNYTNSVVGDGIIVTRPSGHRILSTYVTASGRLYIRARFFRAGCDSRDFILYDELAFFAS